MKRLLLLVLLLPATAFADTNEITPENIVARMNTYRADFGLAPLRLDERVTLAARDRMRDMEDSGYWSHEAPNGMSPFTWLTVRDYSFSAAAENLASGFETAKFLVESWMESHGHRENILSPQFEDCGIAIIDGATTGRATGKSIVVLFGKRSR